MAGLLRIIPFAPNYTITRSGDVRHASNRHKPVPHAAHNGKYGLTHLTVTLDDERHYVWKILSSVWYENRLILNRDGGMMRWNEDDTFVLKAVSKASVSAVTDPDEIMYVWYLYQQKRVPCFSMSEKSALLSHSVDDYKVLIRDILWASVK